MFFSHLVLCDRREGQSSQARYEDQLAEIRLMDELGYWACWFAEHHFAGYALVPDCLLMAAAAARETRRLRLGAGVVVLPFQHHPIRVVEQAAMVDCLSGGRLELGLGRGYQPHEFAGFGVPMEESQERFDQALAVVRQALDQLHGLDYATPRFQGRGASIYPKPVQNPIPCWGASISEGSFARYGALGWPIMTFPANQKPEVLRSQIEMYRRTRREHGHDPGSARVGMTMFCYIEEDAALAHETFERGMEKYFGFLDSITVGAETQQHSLYDRIPTLARLSGSPEDAVKRLRELVDYFDVTDFVNVTQFAGTLSHAQIARSMRLFAERVMPHFPGPGR